MRLALSLRAKVFLLAIANLALLAIVLTVFVRLQIRREFQSFLMDQARERIDVLSRQLVADLQQTEPDGRDALLGRYSAQYGVTFRLVQNDGRALAGPASSIPEPVLARIRNPGPRRPPPPVDPDRERGPDPERGPRRPAPAPPFLVITDGETPYWVGIRVPIAEPGRRPVPGTLLLASATFWTNPFFFPLRPWLAVAALAIAASIVCWAPFVGGVTRSLRRLTEATAEIAEGRFDVAVDEGRGDELGRLGASIRTMAGRLEALVRGQKRFLGDAAHELRSPLGRIQVVLALLERRGREEDAAYLADLREDVELMSKLTDELLALARAELPPDPPKQVPTRLDEVAERVRRLEARGGADVRVEVPPRVVALADPEALFRALANVVRNAVRHAGTAGPIVVRAEPAGRDVIVSVADVGPGLPPGSLERVFEPFYRVEEARTRRTGGVGLGLAIARAAVAACGGSIECRNRTPGPGLVVSIRLRAA